MELQAIARRVVSNKYNMRTILRNKKERDLGYRGLLLVFVIPILFCCQCQRRAADKTLHYQKTFQAATLSDSSYVSDVRCIRYFEGLFFVSDYNRGQVVALNRDLNVMKTYGNAGKGPGEITGALGVYPTRENIYCVNQGAQSIEVYDLNSGIHKRSIRLPIEILGTTLNTRIFEQEGHFFFAAPASGNLVAVFDDSGMQFKFGALIPFETSFETMIRNSSFLFQTIESKILVVSDNIPEIRLFDSTGNQELKVDISFIEPIKQRLYFSSNAQKRANSFHNLFEDVYYQDGLLYLLAISGKDKPVCNEVVILSLDKNDVRVHSVVPLDGRWYTSIAVDKSRNLLVYNAGADQLEYYTFNSN